MAVAKKAVSAKKPKPSEKDRIKAMRKTVQSVGKSGLANSAVVAKPKNKKSPTVLTNVNAKRPTLKRAKYEDYVGSAAQRGGETYGDYELKANKLYRERYNAKLAKQNAKIKSNAKKIYGK